MNKWEQHGMEEKVLAILRDVPEFAPGHHLGRPFLTAYQIAIEFARRHPDTFKALGYPVGGTNVGTPYSLSNYLAQQLSTRIRDKRIPVEGGFLSNQHLKDISFRHGNEVLHSSLTTTEFTLTMFRLAETKT